MRITREEEVWSSDAATEGSRCDNGSLVSVAADVTPAEKPVTIPATASRSLDLGFDQPSTVGVTRSNRGRRRAAQLGSLLWLA